MKKVIKTRVVKPVEQPVAKAEKQYAPSYPSSSRLVARVGEYNGSKVIALRRTAEDKFPFTFGLAKAKLIVEHIDEIRQFVVLYGELAKKKAA